MPKAVQVAISSSERRELRKYGNETRPKPSQHAIKAWFQEKYGRTISQAAISKSLSSAYAHLDREEVVEGRMVYRERAAKWPAVEVVLYEWIKLVESRGGSVPAYLMKEKGLEIWKRSKYAEGGDELGFSDGWLMGFKKRHGIKGRYLHGEKGSFRPEEAEAEMETIRRTAATYSIDDIYNMDETGLFWKMTPSFGLATANLPGVKKEKSRLTVAVCCNASGSDKLPLWVINKHETPRSLQRVNISSIGLIWRWNRKAWIEGIIMTEWLHAFYKHVQGRRVLLLMDNFIAHKGPLEDDRAPAPDNVKVLFFPLNATSVFQPLDQGIIKALKSHYKWPWMRFMAEKYTAGLNLMSEVNLRISLRWLVDAWHEGVTARSIENCFRKSTVLQDMQLAPLVDAQPANLPPIADLFAEVRRAGHFEHTISLADFIEPADEVPDEAPLNTNDEEQLLNELCDNYLNITSDSDDEETPLPPPITEAAARDAVRTLTSYLEEREFSDKVNSIRSHLARLEREIDALEAQKKVQSTLTTWLRGPPA